MKDTYISTTKIKLILMSDIEDKKENEKYRNDVYTYLRNSMKAQNEAFNILTSAIYTAKKLNKSKQNIDDIYYSYSHKAPLDSDDNEKFLEEVLDMSPVTEEKIEEKINQYREYRLNQKKTPKTETLDKACEKKRNKYSVYIGKNEDDIKREINRIKDYCAYPKSIYDNFANCIDTPSVVTQQTKSYFKEFGKDILSGKASVRTIKDDNPLNIMPFIFYNKCGDLIGLRYEYDSYIEFDDVLKNKRDVDIYFYMPYKKGEDKLKFKLILGNPHRSGSLRSILKNIFEESYKIKGSKIGFVKNKKTKKKTDLMLYLSYEVPTREMILEENTVVGVDLGVKIPAVCALNNNKYASLYIGSADEFLRIRTKMQKQRSRLQQALRNTNGGKGRKKKLKKLEDLKSREANFVETYCHMVSNRVVNFALKNRAKYINLECLKGYDTSKKILRNWSYYKLQQYITYKAERYGIVVRKINPCYTSQVCSECGHWEEGQRKKQDVFICADDNCRFHDYINEKKKRYINADFNAARNIAMSTLWLDEEVNKKRKKEAANYYGIPYVEKEEEESDEDEA